LKVAIIEPKPTGIEYNKVFNNAFKFDRYSLVSDSSVIKILKKDVDIDIELKEYDWVILVGTEPFKHFTGLGSITTYMGTVVQDKFIPLVNPNMVKFKPEILRPFTQAVQNITEFVTGNKSLNNYTDSTVLGIDTKEEAIKFLKDALNYKESNFISLDSETTALYPRNGYVIGFSLSYAEDIGAYIITDIIDEEVQELMQDLFYQKTVVFHNAKFDLGFFEYHFKFKFPNFQDTMLMHYVLDETPGSHGLKELALKYTKYGDYEKAQTDWIKEYCKKNAIPKSEFTYDLIPFDIIKVYAAIDSIVTYLLYIKFLPLIEKNPKLKSVYNNIMLPGCRMLTDVQFNGVPFDSNRLLFAQAQMDKLISKATFSLRNYPEITRMEEFEGKPFNPNSTTQLRKLLFDYLGLKSTGKKTAGGQTSTDAEVLEKLAEQHKIPLLILEIRKSSKIKNTYIDKIIPQLDLDGRLRTNFNQQVTTSGRLSSSGKLNMQQLPREDPTVKGCIRAKKGSVINSVDLQTAEMYYAAVISGDLALQDVFRTGKDFHSTIAKKVFGLACEVEEVKENYKKLRQAVKAVSFGILYGAGPSKIAETVSKEGEKMSTMEAEQVIKDYFNTFWRLEEWINETRDFIATNGFIYSPLGRKRRLPNVKSIDKGTREHEIRSGLNFIIQSVASDCNLLGAIDMNARIKQMGMRSRIFGLVHDSILAEVPIIELETYNSNILECIQMDRGINILNCPIKCDIEVHEDYSFGKFNLKYGDNL